MGWAVKLKSNIAFLGREALAAQAAKPLAKRLACFTIADPSVVLLGRETIFRDGVPVGWRSSGGYGYTIGANIGIGYIRNSTEGVSADYVLSGRYELEVATERHAASVSLQPLYDPRMERVKS